MSVASVIIKARLMALVRRREEELRHLDDNDLIRERNRVLRHGSRNGGSRESPHDLSNRTMRRLAPVVAELIAREIPPWRLAN